MAVAHGVSETTPSEERREAAVNCSSERGCEPTEGGVDGGVITVYTSLLLPIETEDELAWMKLPMAVAGVLVFVLFKMFGPGKRKPKPNTSGGTYSKFGKYSSRFGGGRSDRDNGSDGVNASELKKLREKLSEIENS